VHHHHLAAIERGDIACHQVLSKTLSAQIASSFKRLDGPAAFAKIMPRVFLSLLFTAEAPHQINTIGVVIDILEYELLGAGPSLVLVHGTGSDGMSSWGTVVEALTAEHTVLLPNLPGSGGSPLPGDALHIDVIADQVVATAQKAGLESFAVAGASLGAAVAIKVAARHPDRVLALATVAGYAQLRPTLRLNLELWAAMQARGDADLGKFLVSLSFSERYLARVPTETLQQIITQFAGDPSPGTAAQIAFTLGIDVRGDLGAVRTPTLVVAPTEDRFVAPEHSAELAAGIPGATLVAITGGHASIFEDPQLTQRVLLDFLCAS
jgi:pimeloyl-ACP methyl ester carboxylesterase